MKTTPTGLGMMLGEPDFALSFGEENEFTLKGGGRFEAQGGREILARGAGIAERASGTAWIFWKANEGAQFHEGLVVEAGMAGGDEAAGQGAQGG